MLTRQANSGFKELHVVLPKQTETFETMPIEVELESVDYRIRKTVNAFTTEKVTGNLETIHWKKHSVPKFRATPFSGHDNRH